MGAALSLNKIEADARATVGNNVTLSGNSVTVSAETVTGEINEFKVWAVAAAGGTDSDTSVAASVGVNIVILNNEATIGNDATITADAGGITMNASTPMAMQNVAASGALGDTAVGAAVAVNVFTISTLATIGDDADIDASGAISLNALSSLDPMDLFEEDIPVIGDLAVTSVAVGGAVSGDSGGVAVGGSVVVDIILTTTTARIGDRADINATVTPGQSLSITASDTVELAGGAGGIGATLGDAGVGIAVVVHVVDRDVIAELGAGAHAYFSGDVTITAASEHDIFTIAASLGASTGVGVAASVIVAVATTTVRAAIRSTSAAPSTVHAGGDMTIGASDIANIELYAGGVAIGDSAGVGVTAVILVKHTTVEAYVGSADPNVAANANLRALGAGGLEIYATQNDTNDDKEIFLLAIGGGGAGTAGVAGSVIVNTTTHVTHAQIGHGTTVNGNNSGAQAGQSIVLRALDHTRISDIAGALAIGGTAGVGAGVDVMVLNKNTRAAIGASSDLEALAHVTVDAESSEEVLSISAGGGFGGTAAVNVNAAVSVITITTEAYVGDGTRVDAGGSVRVSADETLGLNVVAGNIAAGGTAAVGAAVAVPVVTKDTHAWIGNLAEVNAVGGGTAIPVSTGNYTVTSALTQFAPSAVSGHDINLGYDHGWETGQQVVYDKGYGDSFIELVDANIDQSPADDLQSKTYYIVKVNNTTVRVANTFCDALGISKGVNGTCETTSTIGSGGDDGAVGSAPVVTIGLTGGSGNGHRLVATNGTAPRKDESPRFVASGTTVDVGTDQIVLPYKLQNNGTQAEVGDAVVYSAGGGTPIGGLVEGETYYIYTISGDGKTITLAHKVTQDETNPDQVVVLAADIVDLTSTGSGAAHSIVLSGSSPSGDAAAYGPRTIIIGTVTRSTVSR